jgi:hypothetical protein
MEWKTFRFLILNRGGRIGWDQGKKVLEMTQNAATKGLYDKIVTSLNEIKFKKTAQLFAQLRFYLQLLEIFQLKKTSL